jgi:enamine deaminase RidA (YjgF/YER057c/UK114 family)/acyl-CoA hydrolase
VIALAGQTAADDVIAASAGFVAEFDSALSRLVAALEEAGGRPSELLHVRIFVVDMDAYVDARRELGDSYRRRLGDHFPASTLVEVSALLGGAQVELDGLATRRSAPRLAPKFESSDGVADAVIRLRLAPSDARFAGEIVSGSKSMEIFADLETELALREGGDEGLCVAYDMVEFLVALHVGDFVEGRARVVDRGRTSRRVAAEIYKILEVDNKGILQPTESPILAARASATIVVGRAGRHAGR